MFFPRQRLALGGKALALAGAITALGIDFDQPQLGLAVIEFANGHYVVILLLGNLLVKHKA